MLHPRSNLDIDKNLLHLQNDFFIIFCKINFFILAKNHHKHQANFKQTIFPWSSYTSSLFFSISLYMTEKIYVEHFHALPDKLINHLASSLRSQISMISYLKQWKRKKRPKNALSCASTLIIHSSFQLHEKRELKNKKEKIISQMFSKILISWQMNNILLWNVGTLSSATAVFFIIIIIIRSQKERERTLCIASCVTDECEN